MSLAYSYIPACLPQLFNLVSSNFEPWLVLILGFIILNKTSSWLLSLPDSDLIMGVSFPIHSAQRYYIVHMYIT